MRELRYLDAFNEALHEEMARNAGVVVLGEDVRLSIRGFTKGILDTFGPERIFDTPISEAGLIGLATGAALAGMRPVIEYQSNTLIYVAFDQLVNQAQKLRYMMGGQGTIPVTYIVPSGARGGLAGQHSDHPYPLLVHMGMKVVMPTTPSDAKGLLKAAIRSRATFCRHAINCSARAARRWRESRGRAGNPHPEAGPRYARMQYQGMVCQDR